MIPTPAQIAAWRALADSAAARHLSDLEGAFVIYLRAAATTCEELMGRVAELCAKLEAMDANACEERAGRQKAEARVKELEAQRQEPLDLLHECEQKRDALAKRCADLEKSMHLWDQCDLEMKAERDRLRAKLDVAVGILSQLSVDEMRSCDFMGEWYARKARAALAKIRAEP